MSRKQPSPRTLFDEQNLLDKLSKLNDPLEKLTAIIDFEVFRTKLDELLKKKPKGKGGRPPYDYVLMFKIIILQRYYNLSDDTMEFQILDRMSFKRFLGVDMAHDIPDSKTIWLFKERLGKEDGIKLLFDHFKSVIEGEGFIAHEGKMVDASFVEVPRQRNSREENAKIKAGEEVEEWEAKPHKKRQKDVDARWTKKNAQTFYGYKDHVKGDTKSKLITDYQVGTASEHDSQRMSGLLQEEDREQPCYADSAYVGEEIEKALKEQSMENQICEKGTRGCPLTEKQKASNRMKSKTRVRVEHIFGFIENSMGGSTIRTIGLSRATTQIGLMNLTYNMFRVVQLCKIQGRGMPNWV